MQNRQTTVCHKLQSNHTKNWLCIYELTDIWIATQKKLQQCRKIWTTWNCSQNLGLFTPPRNVTQGQRIGQDQEVTVTKNTTARAETTQEKYQSDEYMRADIEDKTRRRQGEHCTVVPRGRLLHLCIEWAGVSTANRTTSIPSPF